MELVPSRKMVPARASATVAALALATAVSLSGGAQAASATKGQGSSAPRVLGAKNFAVSPPVRAPPPPPAGRTRPARALPPAWAGAPRAPPPRITPLAHEPNHGRPGTPTSRGAGRDPLAA